MNKKTYEVIGPRTLRFDDGQVAEPGATFTRDYDPTMERQHLQGGHIRVKVKKTEPTIPTAKPEKSWKGDD